MKTFLFHKRWPLLTVAVLILAAALTAWRYRLPPVAEPSADGFSAAQAMATLRQLLPDDTPHPRGSAAHAAVIRRLVGLLQDIGVEPEIQNAEACSPFGPCAAVQNVVVQFPGQTEEIILLSAHTDSVPTGPGAADDGQGVAILIELARYLKGKSLHNPVTLVFTDGEEDGLFGAVAFVEGHPDAAKVAANINLEARGQTGLSSLFRTAGEDAWLIALYAKHAPRPFTSSVHQVVFETMPHYTDLSIWKSFGIPGVDFAFFDGPEHYHQASDTVDRLDPRSVQSQGDNALAMLKGLLDADLAHPARGHANWFDVLGVFVLHWPRSWTLWITLLTTVITLGAGARLRKTHDVRWRELLFGLFLVALSVAGTVLLGMLLSAIGASSQYPWVAIVFVLPFLWPMAVGHLFRRTPALSLHLGASLALCVGALPIALFWPGVAHLFVVPALFAALGWLFHLRNPSTAVPLAALLALSATTVLWFPLLEGLRIALGPEAVVPIATGVGVVAMWTLPLWRTS